MAPQQNSLRKMVALALVLRTDFKGKLAFLESLPPPIRCSRIWKEKKKSARSFDP